MSITIRDSAESSPSAMSVLLEMLERMSSREEDVMVGLSSSTSPRVPKSVGNANSGGGGRMSSTCATLPRPPGGVSNSSIGGGRKL